VFKLVRQGCHDTASTALLCDSSARLPFVKNIEEDERPLVRASTFVCLLARPIDPKFGTGITYYAFLPVF
jgi:hypothetical protein